MTRVLIIIGDARPAREELAECDIAVQLNAECSDGETVKDRYGPEGNHQSVKVVTV